MNDSKTMGSLANKLLGYVNTTTVHDTNFDIAVAMIKNYPKLRNMSISEMADICFVSKASITRFCHFMGFDNFREFNFYLQQDFKISSDYSKQFQTLLRADQQMALSIYRDELISNIYATVAPDNVEKIPEIVQLLHDSERVAYFSHHFLWDIGRYFECKMMLMGRYVEQFLDYSAQLECARSLGPNDLAIVCSVGGSYPSRYSVIWNAIETSGCKILAITQNRSNSNWNCVSHFLYCGNSNRDDIGKYSALMATDLLVIHYMKKYGDMAI